MAEEDQDKSDPASEYKLQKSRERGSVAKSQDITFVAILFGLTCGVFGMGDSFSRDIAGVMRAVLNQVSSAQTDPMLILPVIGHATVEIMHLLAMPLAIVAVLAIVASVAQVGFVLSGEPLKPDFTRINPAQGLKRLFSMRSIYDLVRSLLKMGLVAMLLWLAGGWVLKQLVALPLYAAPGLLAYLIQVTGGILAALTALFGLLAFADLAYTRWEFLKKMRMSKREVKDEHKQRDGDPRIKARLRELRMEWFKKGLSMQKVKDADVLLTNPTHLAVAIAYRRETMAAPKVLTKGAGEVAMKMREVARRHGVMVVENPPLARSLYRLTSPDDDLPEQHYAEVAKVLAWVYAARKKSQ